MSKDEDDEQVLCCLLVLRLPKNTRGLYISTASAFVDLDEDDDDHQEHRGSDGVAYLSDAGYALYITECGDCHMAYPPTMLPAAS